MAEFVLAGITGLIEGIKEGMMYNKQVSLKEKELAVQQSQFQQSLTLKEKEFAAQKEATSVAKEDIKLTRVMASMTALDKTVDDLSLQKQSVDQQLVQLGDEESEDKKVLQKRSMDMEKEIGDRIKRREILMKEIGAEELIKANPVIKELSQRVGGKELLSEVIGIKEGDINFILKGKDALAKINMLPEGEEKRLIKAELVSRLKAAKKFQDRGARVREALEGSI